MDSDKKFSNASNKIDEALLEVPSAVEIETMDSEKSENSTAKENNSIIETELTKGNGIEEAIPKIPLVSENLEDANNAKEMSTKNPLEEQVEIECTKNASIVENEPDGTVTELCTEKSPENCLVAQQSLGVENSVTDQLMDTEKPNSGTDVMQATSSTQSSKAQCQIQIKEERDHEDSQPTVQNVSETFATVVIKSEQNRRNLVGARNFITKSSLGLLAQYDSDSDEESAENEQEKLEDDVVEVAIDATKDYRDQIVEIHSESESESSSSDSDVEYIAKIRKEIEKSMELEEDDDEDDDDDEPSGSKNKKKKAQNSMRVKGELGLEDLPPIQDLHISVPEEECIVLGKIHSIVDQLLLVNALPDSTLYDLDTILFLDKGRRVLGAVFDVLGQVADPLYCVRFNSHADIEEKGIKVGDAVYVAPKTEHTQFVIMSSLMKMRGSDASWENDIEPPPRYLDYSDDEQEREARQRLRNKDRSLQKDCDNHDAVKRARDDLDETASVSSVASSNYQAYSPNVQRGGRFSRGNAHRTANNAQNQRSHFNNHRSQYQMPNNPNIGSWHSNYNRPYSHNRPQMTMPPMPMPINPAYQPFPHYGHFPPTMLPPHSPSMFVQNPYAMRPPQLSPQIHPRTIKTRSPSPPPPGLE